MTTTTHPTKRLPDMIGWDLRRPTMEECKFVGRETIYALSGSAPRRL